MGVEIDTTKDEISIRTTLRHSGNSTVVTLAPAILDAAGFEEGDAVNVVSRVDEDAGEITLRAREDDSSG